MRNKLILILSLCFIYPDQNTVMNGDVNYYFMTRLSNNNLVNIPFRLLNLNIYHQNNNIDVNGNFSIEYRPITDTDFMDDSNSNDINLNIRELYINYLFDKGEISIGKKIFTWGNADENCPIDNLNPYDYYYLLQGPSDRKLGIYSLSFDFYFKNDFRLIGVFSPMHNASRIPLDDPSYSIGFEIPEDIIHPSSNNTVLLNDRPFELALSLQKSFNRSDFSISYLNAYDRVFSLSAFNIWTNNWNTNTQIAPLFSYRSNKAVNIGGVLLFDDFTIRFDKTYFTSKDEMNEEYLINVPVPEEYSNLTKIETSVLVNEKANYTQQTLQLEIPLPSDYQLNLQYFENKITHYENVQTNGDFVCEDISITNVDFDCSTFPSKDNVILGLGAPFALLSSELGLITLEKSFIDNELNLTINSVYDLDKGKGSMLTLEISYELMDNFEWTTGASKITGDDSITGYTFNSMEDLSHFRTELKYSF